MVRPRPALILSSESFNEDHSQVIAAMITTGRRSSWPSDVQISDLKSAGLKHPSLVRWKVFTVPMAHLGPRLGRLSPADQERINRQQAAVLGPG
jgi:mRNA interferase MazF